MMLVSLIYVEMKLLHCQQGRESRSSHGTCKALPHLPHSCYSLCLLRIKFSIAQEPGSTSWAQNDLRENFRKVHYFHVDVLLESRVALQTNIERYSVILYDLGCLAVCSGLVHRTSSAHPSADRPCASTGKWWEYFT